MQMYVTHSEIYIHGLLTAGAGYGRQENPHSTQRRPRLPWWWWLLRRRQRCCFPALCCLFLSSAFCAFQEFHVGRRETLGLCYAPPCSPSSLQFLQEPICSLSHPGSISVASHWRCTAPSLPSSRCLLGSPSLVCNAGMVGG